MTVAAKRVPLDLVLVLLNQEADRTNDDRYRNIRPDTLRQWKARGHITRGRGYDLIELTAYLERRFGAPTVVSA